MVLLMKRTVAMKTHFNSETCVASLRGQGSKWESDVNFCQVSPGSYVSIMYTDGHCLMFKNKKLCWNQISKILFSY